MPWKKQGSKNFQIWVTNTRGERRICSTGTTHKATAKAIEVPVGELRHGHYASRAALLDFVLAGTLTLRELYDARDDPTGLLQRVKTGGTITVRTDTEDFVARATAKVLSDKSKARIKRAFDVLCAFQPVPSKPPLGDWPLQDLTTATLMAFAAWVLGGEAKTAAGTAAAADTINGWFSYVLAWLDDCVLRARFLANPGRHPGNGTSLLGRAKKSKVAPLYMTEDEARLVLDALPSLEDQAYQAILLGTAADATPALGLRRRDIAPDPTNPAALLVDVPGTKTETRARTVPLAAWATPYVQRYLHAKPELDLLFPNLTRERAHARLKSAMNRLVDAGRLSDAMRDYQMRHHRHSFAVRLVRAGAPSQIVGARMGHVSGKQVEAVYGRHAHTFEDYYRFDRTASQHASGQPVTAESPALTVEPTPYPSATTGEHHPAEPPVRTSATRDKIDWPSLDELQARVRRDGYRQVARELGVSDNAVRNRLPAKDKRPRARRRPTPP